jgi:hypothetical protein
VHVVGVLALIPAALLGLLGVVLVLFGSGDCGVQPTVHDQMVLKLAILAIGFAVAMVAAVVAWAGRLRGAFGWQVWWAIAAAIVILAAIGATQAEPTPFCF